jgi:hypothetical protein
MGSGSIPGRGTIVFISIADRPSLEPTQPPIQYFQGYEPDSLLPSNVEVKNGGPIPPHSYMHSWHNAQLIKNRDNFTFYIHVYMCMYMYYFPSIQN